MSRPDSQVPPAKADAARHLAAVRTTLSWADSSAARGDYADALLWIQVVEATGHEPSDEYQAKRRAWLNAGAPQRAGASS